MSFIAVFVAAGLAAGCSSAGGMLGKGVAGIGQSDRLSAAEADGKAGFVALPQTTQGITVARREDLPSQPPSAEAPATRDPAMAAPAPQDSAGANTLTEQDLAIDEDELDLTPEQRDRIERINRGDIDPDEVAPVNR